MCPLGYGGDTLIELCKCGCGELTKGTGSVGYKAGHCKRKIGFPDEVLIDSEDRLKFEGISWRISDGYVAASRTYANGKRRKLYLHREIMNAPEGIAVDHINRNPLDNRKANLRLVTHQVNCQNAGLRSNNTSGYRGVSWNKIDRKWVACVRINYQRKTLGYFTDVHEAGRFVAEYRKKHMEGATA